MNIGGLLNTTDLGGEGKIPEPLPSYYRGPALPKDVTNSIRAYPYMDLVGQFCQEQKVNLYLFGSARDRVLFQSDTAIPLDPITIGDLDFVVPLSGSDFSMFCMSLRSKIFVSNLEGLALMVDTKNIFPQAHIVQNGKKIISLYGTFSDAKSLSEVERVMNRLSTSPLDIEQTTVCLPFHGESSYVVSHYKDFKFGRQNRTAFNPESPQLTAEMGTPYYVPGLNLGRFLDKRDSFGLPVENLYVLMRRIYDQFKLMDLGVLSILYRKKDFFYDMSKRVASFLAVHEMLEKPCKIGQQEVLFSNYAIPLSEIPAILVQFPFLQKYYEGVVGLPIQFSDKDLLTSEVFTQLPEGERQNRVQVLNRLLVFNSFVTLLAEDGYTLKNISEYVGVALASAVLADDLMDIPATDFERLKDTYWYVESPEYPAYDLLKIWRRYKLTEETFESMFIAMGPGSYEEYRNLILSINATNGIKNARIDLNGVFDVGQLREEIKPLIPRYVSLQKLGISNSIVATD